MFQREVRFFAACTNRQFQRRRRLRFAAGNAVSSAQIKYRREPLPTAIDCFFVNWMLIKCGCAPSLLHASVSCAQVDRRAVATHCHKVFVSRSLRCSTPKLGFELDTDQDASEPMSRRRDESVLGDKCQLPLAPNVESVRACLGRR